jgi:hypothetical protein
MRAERFTLITYTIIEGPVKRHPPTFPRVPMRRHCSHCAITLYMALCLPLLAACSSGTTTGPNGLSAAQLATHFDSIYSALLAGGTTADTGAGQAIASYVELGPAYGGVDVPITVTTDSGTQTWRGVAYEEVASSGFTSVTTAIYSDRNLSQLIIVMGPSCPPAADVRCSRTSPPIRSTTTTCPV